MKKPISIVLSVLLVAAVALSCVFGVQKSDISKEANQVKADLTASQTKVTELEASVKELNANAETSTAALAAAQADIEKLTADNSTVNEALTTANDALTAAKAEVEKLVADNATVNEALTAAKAEVEKLVADNTAVNEALTAAKAEVEKLTADCAAANEALTAAKAEVEKLVADNTAANEALTAAKAEVEKLTADNTAANEALAAAKAEVEKLVAEAALVEAPVAEEAPVVEETPAAEAVTPDPYISNARSYLRMLYKNSPEITLTDYDVLGSVSIDGNIYPVTWTADSDTVKIVAKDDGMVTIDVKEKNAEEVVYVLTGVLTSPLTGETAEVAFTHSVPATASTGVIYAENPEVGQAYKFALNQNGLTPPTTLYLTGEMSGNYLATTANVLEAVDVYLEETEGGYYIYFNAGEAKKYVNITTYAKDDGSLKNTQKIEDAPSVPYTWDAERGTMVADLGDLGKFYLGTYNTYNTMSTSNVSYIADVSKIGASQFPAGFATMVPTPVETPEVGKAYVFGLQQNGLETPATLYLTGEMSGNYLATSASLSDAVVVYVEQAEGGYYLYFLKDGVKNYVNITTYAKDDGSLKNTQKIEAEPSVPYTWDAERYTFVGDLGEVGQFYLGTYNTYNTISTSNVSYIADLAKIGTSQFPATLYDVQLPTE